MAPIDELINPASETTKPRAFAASELVGCASCARSNPPTRSTCLYCGAALPFNADRDDSPATTAQPEGDSTVRFYVSVRSQTAEIEGTALNELANSSRAKLLRLGDSFALATTSKTDAQMVSERLAAMGIETDLISEEGLGLRTAREIAALECDQESLTAFTHRTVEKVSTSWEKISLIVTGRFYFSHFETDQKRKGKKEVVDERELVTDEAVLDLYLHDQEPPWRIRAARFDFSCLGDEKTLTVFDNFKTLIRLLRERASNAIFDDSYVHLRSSLNEIWPIEMRAGEKGKRHTVFGSVDSSVTISDNEAQFTQYSRLVSYLRDHANEA